jgi:hypothetical protein
MTTPDRRRRPRRPRASTVIACIALFAALGGSATAASVISGKNIRKGSITGKQIRNGSLTGAKIKNGSLGVSDLSRTAVASLRGAAGAKGDTGAAGQPGAQGPPGPPGAPGIVTPQTDSLGNKNLPANSTTTVLTKAVPAGTYVVIAKLNMFATTTDTVSCDIEAGNVDVDQARWEPAAANMTNPLTMQAVTAASPAEPLEIVCGTAAGVASVSDVKLTAIPVS